MSSSITEANAITTYRAGSLAPSTALSRIRGASPNPVFTAVGHSGTTTWSDGGAGGVFDLSGSDNSVAAYTPANKTQSIVISATDGVNTKTYSLSVFATIPVYPQFGYEQELDVETKVKMARDRTRYFREDGEVEVSWVFAWSEREKDQYLELMRFWRDHRKVTQFYLVDTEGDLLNKVWFNSSFKAIASGANRWALSAAFKGILEDVDASSAEPIHLRINAGGSAVSPYIADAYSANGTAFALGAFTPNNAGVVNPAPDAVYQSIRYDATGVHYSITGLHSVMPYTVRLHWCENSGTTRVMTPVVAGTTYPDITFIGNLATVIREYNVVSDATGKIDILVNKVSGSNAIVSAIEVYE